MNINKRNAWTIALALLVILPAVLAAINVNIKWTSNLNNFNAQAYHCTDAGCNQVANQLVDASSGSNYYLFTQFTANGTSDYNSVYLQKECFVPKGFIIGPGDNLTADKSIGFIKKKECQASILDLSLSNNNPKTGELVVITTNVKSAFSHNEGATGTPGFIPNGLKKKYYSSTVNVTFEVFNAFNMFGFDEKSQPLFTESKQADILMDTTEDITFTWIPSQTGYYAIRVTTKLADCKCSSSVDDGEFVIIRVDFGTATTTTTTTTQTTTPTTTSTTTTTDTTTTVSSGGGGSSSSGSKDVFYLDDVRLDKYSFMPGEKIGITVDLRKDVGRTLRGIAIRVNIPGLGISRTSDEFVLDEKEETKQFDVTIPGDAEPGDYVMDVIVFNDDRTLDRYVKFTVTGEATEQAGITTTSITGLEGITGSAVRIPDTGSLMNSGLFRIGLMAILTMIIFYIIWRI